MKDIVVHVKNRGNGLVGFLNKENWPTCNLSYIKRFASKEEAEECISSILNARHSDLFLRNEKDPEFTIMRLCEI